MIVKKFNQKEKKKVVCPQAGAVLERALRMSCSIRRKEIKEITKQNLINKKNLCSSSNSIDNAGTTVKMLTISHAMLILRKRIFSSSSEEFRDSPFLTVQWRYSMDNEY
ncbi:CLUMA_CG013433, isoform A [Clunio marinus]|uniref:CLUMA_CG013433, isoform A n=1 Tax=Clunio marinus TaxID=568069 RepID=A0A1J1IIU5_9DIPT|nr:CLUMA_CG013433, isoform A [Clunio marinus]